MLMLKNASAKQCQCKAKLILNTTNTKQYQCYLIRWYWEMLSNINAKQSILAVLMLKNPNAKWFLC